MRRSTLRSPLGPLLAFGAVCQIGAFKLLWECLGSHPTTPSTNVPPLLIWVAFNFLCMAVGIYSLWFNQRQEDLAFRPERHCPHCDYNLASIPDTLTCPECGKSTDDPL